jgi:mandelamide amidase
MIALHAPRSTCGTALAVAALLAVNLPDATAAQAALTAREIAQAVCSGKTRSTDEVRAALDRARDLKGWNAFIHVNEAGASAAASKLAAAKRAARCRPLAGVPIVVKDNIEVAGLPSSAGTPALAGYVPATDAPVVARLRAAGAIVIGKTNMHELAFGVTGWNPMSQTGPEPGVRNAWDRSRIAGGSSSGTGAAVGARVVPAGLGTDTGGSVRIPCAFNGCASLRPTIGRYPQAGIAPISHTRDTAGPMAAAMADVELLDRVIAGGPAAKPASLKTVRLGLAAPLLANLDADTRTAFDAALAKLKAAGVTVIEVDMPRLMELNGAIGFPLALYEAYDDMVAYLKHTGTGVTVEQMAERAVSPDVKGTYQGLVIPRKLPGPNNTVVDARPAYDAAMATARPALQALYKATFRTHRLDALVFPTVPVVALPATPESSSVPNFMLLIQNTDPGSNAGLPGLQIPIGLGGSSKLPIGMELDGPANSDRRLVAIGLAIEKLLGRLPAPELR